MDEIRKTINEEFGNRFKVLLIHGLIGTIGGLLMLAFGVAQTYQDFVGPVARPVLGTLGLVAGLSVLAGLIRYPTGWARLAFGMSCLWLWYLALSIGFAAAMLSVGLPHPSWPWQTPAPVPTRPYVSVVYLGMTLFAGVQLGTILRTRKR